MIKFLETLFDQDDFTCFGKTPKDIQIVGYQSAGRSHNICITQRFYRECNGLLRIRNQVCYRPGAQLIGPQAPWF